MRAAATLMLASFLALAAVGCGGSETTTTAPPPESTTSTEAVTTTAEPITTTTAAPAETTTTEPPSPTAESAWELVLAGEVYRSWRTAPGHETPQPATGPHGVKDQVFANEPVFLTLEGPAATEWPTGSIIVKDVYDAAGTLIVLEYMQKTDAGWYYASFEPDGQVGTEGLMVGGCQSCHSRGSDSVFTLGLP